MSKSESELVGKSNEMGEINRLPLENVSLRRKKILTIVDPDNGNMINKDVYDKEMTANTSDPESQDGAELTKIMSMNVDLETQNINMKNEIIELNSEITLFKKELIESNDRVFNMATENNLLRKSNTTQKLMINNYNGERLGYEKKIISLTNEKNKIENSSINKIKQMKQDFEKREETLKKIAVNLSNRMRESEEANNIKMRKLKDKIIKMSKALIDNTSESELYYVKVTISTISQNHSGSCDDPNLSQNSISATFYTTMVNEMMRVNTIEYNWLLSKEVDNIIDMVQYEDDPTKPEVFKTTFTKHSETCPLSGMRSIIRITLN